MFGFGKKNNVEHHVVDMGEMGMQVANLIKEVRMTRDSHTDTPEWRMAKGMLEILIPNPKVTGVILQGIEMKLEKMVPEKTPEEKVAQIKEILGKFKDIFQMIDEAKKEKVVKEGKPVKVKRNRVKLSAMDRLEIAGSTLGTKELAEKFGIERRTVANIRYVENKKNKNK